MCVFLSHSVVFLKLPGASLSFGNFHAGCGLLWVVFFFVLSGFFDQLAIAAGETNDGGQLH